MATNKNITMKQYNGTDYDVLYPKTKVSQVDGAVASVNNVTPDNTGAVKIDTFDQSIKVGENVDVGTDGGASAVQFHFDGNANAYTSRIVESESGALTVEAILKLAQALGIEFGGTGATDRATALGVLSGGGTYSGDFNNASDPGVYWVNLSSCSNGPSTSGYGWLEICKLSTDDNSRMQRFTYYEDGEIVVRSYVNSQWGSWCRSNSISLPVSVANGGTGANSASGACSNLGAVKTSGDTMTGNLNISTSGNAYLCVNDPSTGESGYFQLYQNYMAMGYTFTKSIRINSSGNIVIPSGAYGSTLPTAGTTGRIFFKKV